MKIRSLGFAVLFVISLVAAAVVAATTQPFVSPIGSTPPVVDAVRLQAHVQHLSEALYPRSHDQLKNIGRAAQYIEEQLKAAGADVSVQEVLVQAEKYKNIVARFGPKSGPVLVIGAHYDSHGDPQDGARYPRGYGRDTHTPGADDNASGVAGLIELARLLQAAPPSKPIELVAYTLEEPPHFRTAHMGSAHHARALASTKREVSLMISLEMIGYFSDAPNSQNYPLAGMQHLYSDKGNFIALVGRMKNFQAIRRTKALMSGATDLPVYSINAPTIVQGIDFSDHLSYWAFDYPALMVTDTAFMRNPHYHRAGDTWEKLDYQRMAKVVQGVYAVSKGL